MKKFRIMAALVAMSLLSSCAMLRNAGSLWTGARVTPGAPTEEAPDGAPQAPREALAPGDVRITVVAEEGVPGFRLYDDDREIGLLQGGKRLQWDRPAGVMEVVAIPVQGHTPTVRFVGLFLPGEQTLPLGREGDGLLAFSGSKRARLSEARRISRLRCRAQRLPMHLATAYLEEHLFAAPAPGRLRSAYADADQAIVPGNDGPVLTWLRFDVRDGRRKAGESAGYMGHSQSLQCAFSRFVDADIRLGVTARVAFRRGERDIEPARAIFRMNGKGNVAPKLESLLVALMVCCPMEESLH